MKRHETVDAYIEDSPHWKAELIRLRKILAGTPLDETVKWGAPCYTFEGKNVVGMAAFKSYVGLWFHQGALLSDPEGVLINAQAGKTKALRQWRFGSIEEIRRGPIRRYVEEAIALQEQGRAIKPRRGKAVEIPPELEAALSKSQRLRSGFEALTPGKRREYAEYVAEAKRAETRARRLAKIEPMILAGRGLHDKYRGCG